MPLTPTSLHSQWWIGFNLKDLHLLLFTQGSSQPELDSHEMGEIKSDFLTEGMDGEMMAKAKARRTLHDDREPLQGQRTVAGPGNLQHAWHASAITNAKGIIERGLVLGPSQITKTPRIYCEGDIRRHCTYGYMTHTNVEGFHPLLMFGCCFELVVDRDEGGTHHHQWTQTPESVQIVCMHIHVCNLLRMYNSGYRGWFRVHKTALELAATYTDQCMVDKWKSQIWVNTQRGNLLSEIISLYIAHAPARICKFTRLFNYTYTTTEHRKQLRDALVAKYVEVEV